MFNPAWLSLRFNADEAAFLTGAKLPQIEYFVRNDLIVPVQPASRRGISRGYDLKNVIEIAVAAELLNSGIQAIEIGRALADLRGQWDMLFGDAKQREQAAYLVVVAQPLTSIRPSPHTTIEIGPPRMLWTYGKSGAVLRAAVPLESDVRNIESKIWALEQWKANRPVK